MQKTNPQKRNETSNGNRVRIYLSHEVAYDLDKMNKITANVLGKLGCGGCHSGRILDFVFLQDFVVDPRTLEVHEAGPQAF